METREVKGAYSHPSGSQVTFDLGLGPFPKVPSFCPFGMWEVTQ